MQRDDAKGRLRDVHRVVTDALQIARDLDGADDEPQVARHRLLKGQQLDRGLLHFELELVDLAVAMDDGIGLVLVARQQRVDGDVDELLGARGHVQQLLLEEAELRVEVPRRYGFDARHPNLPVMYASVRSSRGLVNIRSVAPYSTSRPR